MFQAPAINPIAVELYATDPAVGTPTTDRHDHRQSTRQWRHRKLPVHHARRARRHRSGHLLCGDSECGIYRRRRTAVWFPGQRHRYAGNGGTDVTDDNIEDDNDGVFVAGVGFVSGPITLAIGAEPSGGGNENNTVDFGVLPTTDLRIDKTLSGTSNVIAGGTAVFTVTVNNLGASEATDVSVSDVIPAGLTFVNVLDSSSTPVTTISSTEGGRPVRTFDVGTLAAGAPSPSPST